MQGVVPTVRHDGLKTHVLAVPLVHFKGISDNDPRLDGPKDTRVVVAEGPT